MGAIEARRGRYERNLSALDRAMVRTDRGDRVSAASLLRRPGVRLESLASTGQLPLELEPTARTLDIASLENDVKYEGYLKQERSHAERLRKQERRRIPDDFPFARVPGLSREAVQRFRRFGLRRSGKRRGFPG
jgi:tRNA uridine 5-carboxymethylaminomethyl modification enzyme